ncbi:P-loop containing nucleoside triphosphate hydrolase protein [Trametes meyenii]|nr:P-loop containing nucleoside triphosphate hydrolase protein [Trametes meyenii]
MSLLVQASCRHALPALFDRPCLSCPFPPGITSNMAPKTRTIYQNLIDDDYPPIAVQEEVMESKLTKELFQEFFTDSPTPRRVGLAPIYSESGNLFRLAVATANQVLIIHFHAKGKGANAYKGRQILTSEVLCNPDVLLLAFDFGKLAIALHADQNVAVVNGIDIPSACGCGREPLAAIEFVVGERVPVMKDNVIAAFESTIQDTNSTICFAQQAWVAQCLAAFPEMEDRFQAAHKINTRGMSDTELQGYIQLVRGEHRLVHNAPSTTVHEYSTVRGAHSNQPELVQIKADRFQTRFREGKTNQKMVVHDPSTGLDFTVEATVEAVNGRRAHLKTGINLNGRTITSVISQGRDAGTNADRMRDDAVLLALQGRSKIYDSPFLKYIFQYSDDFTWPENFPDSHTIPPIVTPHPLNDSQQHAVTHMLTNKHDTRISIIQGPPGTGKTSVIAAYVTSAVAAGVSGIWLMAQSNIAVKNIAEKLADIGFQDWRLLVSKDFHVGWHEHIYGQVIRNVITSAEFRSAAPRVKGVPVILCTLSMLSHPRISMFTCANPIKTMVIDEASQITLGNYISPLKRFSTINKLCMIGDDKQLPPYGSEDDPNMKSIFEVDSLRETALFLNTQYRMPPLIGDVISEAVYDGQLQSNPNHPISGDTPCCWFVHVEGSEEQQHEKSIHNPTERATVLKIAEKLQVEGKNYAIITPYDAQRSFLEMEMKEAGLVWQDRCFNVDSFQGMYVVSSWGFVTGRACNTLVGRMAAAWGDDVWIQPDHLEVEA